MKQEDRSVMTSAVRRLGQEISKLGLRMRNRSPSGSDSDVFSSTDELAAKESELEDALPANASRESRGASGSFDAGLPVKQRRHSRNELDEDVECRERKSSIKAALRPVLSRKSRSDLAKYNSRPNHDLNLKQEPLKRNGSENSIKENSVAGITPAKNGKSKGKEETSSMTYRIALKSEATENVDKTTKPKRSRRMKRSKSFSGLLGWRHGAKQGRKDSAENDAKSVEFPSKVLRRTNSFSGKVETNKPSLENSINLTLQKQAFVTPDINATQRNNLSKFSPEIIVTSPSNGDDILRNGGARKQSETRLSYMALKGFRYEEGMIETDLCSTEL